MRQLLINTPTGEISYYPLGDAPTSIPYSLIVDVTPEINDVLAQGGPFTWLPDDLENPTGKGSLVKVSHTLEEQKAAKVAEIKDARKVAEHAGVEVTPFGLLPTDAEAQFKLTAIYFKAMNDPTYTKNWKVGDTTWATLDAATIIAIGDAVEAHVQAQFDKERTLSEQVTNATTIEELEAIKW